MGQCEVCSKQGEFNAVDTNDLMSHLQETGLAQQIQRLRNDNRQCLLQYRFSPMPDRSFYRGKIVNLLRQGYGQLYFDDFNYYGFFKNDLPNGQGALITEKECYYGDFVNGEMHGDGKEWNKQFSFEGQYQEGKRIKGKLQKQELTYIGQLKDDHFSGQGKLTLKDGTVYQGQLDSGVFNGNGSISYPNGNSYKGEFKEGQYHGYGEFSWKNGNNYRGNYQKGVREGQGVLKVEDVQFAGHWKGGVREGHGTFSKNTQEPVFGEWSNNVLLENH